MGRICAPFGVNGWVRVRPFTQELDGLLAYQEWWVRGRRGWDNYRVDESGVHGANLVVRLEGFADREAAVGLKNRDVAIPRDRMPEAGSGEYYWADLLELEVENVHGERLGHVERLLETGANTVLVVKGERQRLLPFVSGVVLEVNPATGKLRVDWGPDY